MLNKLIIISFFFVGHWALGADNSMGQDRFFQYAIVDSLERSVDPAFIASLDFKEAKVPRYLGGQDKSVVVKIDLESRQRQILRVQFPAIENLRLYVLKEGNYTHLHTQGALIDFEKRNLGSHNLVFDLREVSGVRKTDSIHLLLVADSRTPVFVPIDLVEPETQRNLSQKGGFLFGIFIGVFVALFLYNLFLWFSTRDLSYLPYLIFLIAIALAQAATSGFGYKYIWSNSAYFNSISVPFLSSVAGISGLLFAKEFLNVRQLSNKSWLWWVNFFILLYVVPGVLAISGEIYWSFNLLNLPGVTATIYLLALSFYRAKQGYRPAVFYFIAWFVFMLSVVILSLRNLSILPFNDFASLLIYGGAALVAILLSLALADRINILRREKEQSQQKALEASQENERIISEQNILLEQKVDERTQKLQETNESLTETLNNLREAQSQLIDAEKMASIGQLTAGIAHEINNPINFVTSNVEPLRRDLEDIYELIDAYAGAHWEDMPSILQKAHQLKHQLDYDYLKEEIDSLVKGISEGANRTSEIVKGLRTFSRLDEDAVKYSSVHENLESTLILLKNKIRDEVSIIKDYDSDLPDIECYPGKLNQVFMNILNNAIYAVLHKNHPPGGKPTISLKTRRSGDQVHIHFIDNGIGMDEATCKRMYEPFFTTKDVGEGTGLGMSIVYKIIQKHDGKLEVNSKLGTGTEFVITLPMRQPKKFE